MKPERWGVLRLVLIGALARCESASREIPAKGAALTNGEHGKTVHGSHSRSRRASTKWSKLLLPKTCLMRPISALERHYCFGLRHECNRHRGVSLRSCTRQRLTNAFHFNDSGNPMLHARIRSDSRPARGHEVVATAVGYRRRDDSISSRSATLTRSFGLVSLARYTQPTTADFRRPASRANCRQPSRPPSRCSLITPLTTALQASVASPLLRSNFVNEGEEEQLTKAQVDLTDSGWPSPMRSHARCKLGMRNNITLHHYKYPPVQRNTVCYVPEQGRGYVSDEGRRINWDSPRKCRLGLHRFTDHLADFDGRAVGWLGSAGGALGQRCAPTRRSCSQRTIIES